MFRFVLLCFCLVLAGCNLLKPSKRVDPVEVVVSVEVDGKPYEIKRTIQCWINYGWDAANGNTSSSMIDFTIFGEKIHDGQALVIDMPNLCSPNYYDTSRRRTKGWILKDSMINDYYPKITILDDYYNPQSIEMYHTEAAYKAETSRVKYKGFTVRFVPLNKYWPFQADWEDRFSRFRLESRRYDHGDNYKYFLILAYTRLPLTDEALEEIVRDFPSVQRSGTYRLEQNRVNNKSVRRPDGGFIPNGGYIKNMIGRRNGCRGYASPTNCLPYFAQQSDQIWNIDTSAPTNSVGYLVDKPIHLNSREPWNFDAVLDGVPIIIDYKPTHYNAYIDFDNRVFWEFSFYYKAVDY